jgi:CheY-like chemotaxis protein
MSTTISGPSGSRLVQFLLVEDDEDHAELVRGVLAEHRIANVFNHVWDGEQAMRYLRREGEFSGSTRPDIILLDVKLPRMDGLEVLAAIKADEKLMAIPVVMLTTSNAEMDRLEAYRHHVNSYVVKPVDFTRFSELVRTLGLYWAVWNAPPPAVLPPAI